MVEINHVVTHIEENVAFIEQIEDLKRRVKKLEAEVKRLKKGSNDHGNPQT